MFHQFAAECLFRAHLDLQIQLPAQQSLSDPTASTESQMPVHVLLSAQTKSSGLLGTGTQQ